MTHRWFNLVSLVSAVLIGCTVVLWLATFAISPWDHRVSLTHHFHIGVWSGFSGDTLGRLVIFNNAEYGPYRGSIMGIGGPNTHEVRWGWHTPDDDYDFGQITFFGQQGEVVDRLRLCTLPGIYFRHFQLHGQVLPLWTLMVSFWYPLFLFSILPAVWIFRRWRSRHIRHVVS
jgi:hypothetical protein